MARRAKPTADAFPPPSPFPLPETRNRLFGHDAEMQRLQELASNGALKNGWLITGQDGVGKATFAFAAARMLLCPDTGSDGTTSEGARNPAASLIASGAHPDLFIARRPWNPKTKKFATEITVDVIRELTGFMSRTAAMGGARVAIIDTADELNRNAANALLKVLEEPPSAAVLFLLTTQPGRLLATIRSRCRTIPLQTVPDEAVTEFLENEEGVNTKDIPTYIDAAKGRPGYALRLAIGDGQTAIRAVKDLLTSSGTSGAASPSLAKVTGRGGGDAWALFVGVLTDRLYTLIKKSVAFGEQPLLVSKLVTAHDRVVELLAQTDGLNLDKSQVTFALADTLASSGFVDVAQRLERNAVAARAH
ncbi:MAG: hypothetical protein AAGH38_05915 [Pseudomonadota bacterium]